MRFFLLLVTTTFSLYPGPVLGQYDNTEINRAIDSARSSVSTLRSELHRVNSEIAQANELLRNIDKDIADEKEKKKKFENKKIEYQQDTAKFNAEERSHVKKRDEDLIKIKGVLKEIHILEHQIEVAKAETQGMESLNTQLELIKSNLQWISHNQKSLSTDADQADQKHLDWISKFKEQVKTSAPDFKNVDGIDTYKTAVRKIHEFKNKIPSESEVKTYEEKALSHISASINKARSQQLLLRKVSVSRDFAIYNQDNRGKSQLTSFRKIDEVLASYSRSLIRMKSLIYEKEYQRSYLSSSVFELWTKLIKAALSSANIRNGSEIVNMINKSVSGIEDVYARVLVNLQNRDSEIKKLNKRLSPRHARRKIMMAQQYMEDIGKKLDSLPITNAMKATTRTKLSEYKRKFSIELDTVNYQIVNEASDLHAERKRLTQKSYDRKIDSLSPYCKDTAKEIIDAPDSILNDPDSIFKQESRYLEYKSKC